MELPPELRCSLGGIFEKPPLIRRRSIHEILHVALHVPRVPCECSTPGNRDCVSRSSVIARCCITQRRTVFGPRGSFTMNGNGAGGALGIRLQKIEFCETDRSGRGNAAHIKVNQAAPCVPKLPGISPELNIAAVIRSLRSFVDEGIRVG